MMSLVLRISLLAGFVLAGCTATDQRVRPQPSPTPAYDVPIALVTHLSRSGTDLTGRQARDVLAGRLDDWSAIGDGAGPLHVLTASVREASDFLPTASDPAAAVAAVEKDPAALAVVPATAVTPHVRAATVDGVSPVRTPEDYPLTTRAPVRPGAVLTTSIVGDIMLGRRVGQSLAQADDPAAALRPLARRLADADITVCNLESTLSRSGAPTQGGDSFGADPAVLAGLRLAGFDVLSVANNHLGDYGRQAIGETVAELRDGGFMPVGGGTNLTRARAAAIVERKGVRIGFIATDSIGEAPAATADRAGTNRINAPPRTGPLDRRALDRVAADIRALDARTDLVIVLPHWGTQYTNVPERSQRTMARAFTAAGADLVVGGHPHWVQGWETIGDATVIHSLGNFVFDMDFMRQTQEGITVDVISWGDRILAVEPAPYVIGDDFAPRPASPRRAAQIMEQIRGTSSPPYDALR
jgi:poly-gamma-glutamate capsule biosynthesis protein CapA/YwtB (metallophosphatase superfamily)